MNIFKNEYDEVDNSDVDKIKVEDLLDRKITYNTKSMDIETILNGLKRGDYILPKYQRKYVWDKDQASNLILSLIKNIPIPPIYLYYNTYDGKYTILDGQQRITTLFMYYKNIFYKSVKDRKRLDFQDISYKLERVDILKEKLNNYYDIVGVNDKKNIEKEIKQIYSLLEKIYNLKETEFKLHKQDITFKKFNEKTKRILKRKNLDVVFVECLDENPHIVYTQIFKLLNSSGKPLSTQEIRNGVYSENYVYEYIDKVNENNTIWRSIYGNSLISKDFEFLLRFLALDKFTDFIDDDIPKVELNYSQNFSLSNIIDKYSEQFNKKHLTDKDSSTYNKNELIKLDAKREVEKLNKFFDKIKDIRKEDKVNGGKILILEAIFVAFSKLDLLDKDISIEYYNFISELDLEKDFEITTSTSNKGNIEKRLSKAISIVKGKYKI